MRLFFAVELPADVRTQLGRLRGDDRDYRWTEPLAMHVTLAFLGEQPEAALPRLEGIGLAAAAAARAAALRLGEAGSFGPRGAPRVLWIGLAGDVPALLELQAALAEGLRSAAFAVEERAFSPHVTLARRRDQARGRPAWPPAETPSAAFRVTELVLFQSQLSPKGATYTALQRHPLST